MTDEDFAAAEGEATRTIEIHDFVPYDEIDPIYFEQTYYLGPAKAPRRSTPCCAGDGASPSWPAIAHYVMRDKQHLGCLRIRDGLITLERMYFADEIRDVGEVSPEGARRQARAGDGRGS